MHIVVGVLTDVVHILRLIIFAVLDVLGIVIRPVLAGLGLLGFATCGFYALVAPKSHFPQGMALAISTGFIVLLVIYDMIAYSIRPKARHEV